MSTYGPSDAADGCYPPAESCQFHWSHADFQQLGGGDSWGVA